MDKNGVPIYTGAAEQFDEWKERAINLFHSRAGSEGLQAATASALRGGLKDVAYEAVRKVEHKDLMTQDANGKPTIKGVEALIEHVRSSLQQEAPIRVAETFECVLRQVGVARFGREHGSLHCPTAQGVRQA